MEEQIIDLIKRNWSYFHTHLYYLPNKIRKLFKESYELNISDVSFYFENHMTNISMSILIDDIKIKLILFEDYKIENDVKYIQSYMGYVYKNKSYIIEYDYDYIEIVNLFYKHINN